MKVRFKPRDYSSASPDVEEVDSDRWDRKLKKNREVNSNQLKMDRARKKLEMEMFKRIKCLRETIIDMISLPCYVTDTAVTSGSRLKNDLSI